VIKESLDRSPAYESEGVPCATSCNICYGSPEALVIPYQAEMKISKLSVSAVAMMGDKSLDLGTKEIAEAMITTSQRVQREEKLSLGADKYQKISIISQPATIHFAIQQANIRSQEKGNTDMKNLKTFVKKGYVLNSIDITAIFHR